jgi:hypothetical protein
VPGLLPAPLIRFGKPAIFWRLFMDRCWCDRLTPNRVRLAYDYSFLRKSVARLTSLRIVSIWLARSRIGAARNRHGLQCRRAWRSEFIRMASSHRSRWS